MSNFDKIAVSLINIDTKPIDFTSFAGFKGCYIKDPDKPNGEHNFYIMYDEELRNEYSMDRARRFSASPYLKKMYIKFVNHKPYVIYSFWVNKEASKIYDGVFHLTPEQKMHICNYWGIVDPICNAILNDSVFTYKGKVDMPLEDYEPPLLYKSTVGLTIKKSDSP